MTAVEEEEIHGEAYVEGEESIGKLVVGRDNAMKFGTRGGTAFGFASLSVT